MQTIEHTTWDGRDTKVTLISLPEGEAVVSYKPVFKMPDDPKYYDNGQRFATLEEARDTAAARFMVWTMPEAYGVEESTDPVNYEREFTPGYAGTDKMLSKEEAK